MNVELAKRDSIVSSLRDSLDRTQAERDVFLYQRDQLVEESNDIKYVLASKDKELRKIKGSLKPLSNDELVVEANKEYGGSDTTELTILLSRPTTEFLVESAKELRVLEEKYLLVQALNGNFEAQLKLADLTIDTYKTDSVTYESIIKQKDEQILIAKSTASALDKKNRRHKTFEKVLIGIAAGGILYGISK
jgi:hypothetical protein